SPLDLIEVLILPSLVNSMLAGPVRGTKLQVPPHSRCHSQTPTIFSLFGGLSPPALGGAPRLTWINRPAARKVMKRDMTVSFGFGADATALARIPSDGCRRRNILVRSVPLAEILARRRLEIGAVNRGLKPPQPAGILPRPAAARQALTQRAHHSRRLESCRS